MRGTWQTTDGSAGGALAVIAVVILFGSGAAAAVAGALVWIAVTVAVCGVLAVAGAVCLSRFTGRQRAVYAGRYKAAGALVRGERAAQLPPPAPAAVAAPPAGNHVHYHWHAGPGEPAPAAIPRAAIPGKVIRDAEAE